MSVRASLVTVSAFATSLVVGSLVFGSRVALLFCTVVFAHECGHFVVARLGALARSGPIVVFPIGGFVVLDPEGLQRRPRAEASIIVAGPLTGGLLAWVGAVGWWTTRSPDAYALAIISVWVNLINLLPVGALDGGRLARLAGLPESVGWLLSGPVVLMVGDPILAGGLLVAAVLGRFHRPVVEVSDRRAVSTIAIGGAVLATTSLVAVLLLL